MKIPGHEPRYYDQELGFRDQTADELIQDVKMLYITEKEPLQKLVEILEAEKRPDDAKYISLYLDKLKEEEAIREKNEYNMDNFIYSNLKIDYMDKAPHIGKDVDFDGEDYSVSESIWYEPSNDTFVYHYQRMGSDNDGVAANCIPAEKFMEMTPAEIRSWTNEVVYYNFEPEEPEIDR